MNGMRRTVDRIGGEMPGYNFVHSTEVILEKITGYRITTDELAMTGEGREVLRLLHELTGVEYLLHIARKDMLRLAEKIRINIESRPGEEIEEFFAAEVNTSKIGTIDQLLEDRQSKWSSIKLMTARILQDDPAWARVVEKRTAPEQPGPTTAAA